MATEAIRSIGTVRPEIAAALSKLTIIRDFSIVATHGREDSAILQDRDKLFVPRLDPYIYLSGSVRKPGAYRFEQGSSYLQYVERAGGYTSRADRRQQFVIAYFQGGVYQFKDVHDLDPGNILVVPDSQHAKYFSTIVLPIISVAATTITALLAVVSFFR